MDQPIPVIFVTIFVYKPLVKKIRTYYDADN